MIRDNRMVVIIDRQNKENYNDQLLLDGGWVAVNVRHITFIDIVASCLNRLMSCLKRKHYSRLTADETAADASIGVSISYEQYAKLLGTNHEWIPHGCSHSLSFVFNSVPAVNGENVTV